MTPRPEQAVLKEEQQSSCLAEDEDPLGPNVVEEGSISYWHWAPHHPWRPLSTKSALEINATELNLHLGRSYLWSRARNPWVLQFIRLLLSVFLVDYWEQHVFRLYNMLPTATRRALSYTAWKLYFPIHQYFFSNTTAIHPHASLEYHALTTVMYWGRFFPVNVPRMRFMLQQLTPCQPSPLAASRVETIDERVVFDHPPKEQGDFCRVQGLYLYFNKYDTAVDTAVPFTEYTLFWVYGGAFLSGDAVGNMGPADRVAAPAGLDVFIPTYRLAPEHCMDDIVWDIILAYRWLYDLRKRRGQDPNKILMFGCSSGAALCLRLMQSIVELQQQKTDEILPPYLTSILHPDMMPRGAALASPYLDYSPDLDPAGSFLQYSQHDLIVTEAVQEAGLPYLDTHMGRSGDRIRQSPLKRSLNGLPPLCILVSQHETVYDETVLLIERARAAGVPVTVGLWKYLCHVFLFLNGFIPEGKQAMDFLSHWYREMQQQ
jgi:epsilon-lactone hydrolase